MKYTVDATKKPLGRLATEIATILRGKNAPTFSPEKKPTHVVHVQNIEKMTITPRKLAEKYVRYSGYPGGLKHETREHVMKRRGTAEVLIRTVRGMLPRNKLRPVMLKNLIIE